MKRRRLIFLSPVLFLLLIAEMEQSIREADAFIRGLNQTP